LRGKLKKFKKSLQFYLWVFMKSSFRQQFERLALRLNEINATLAEPSVVNNMTRFLSLNREQAQIDGVLQHFDRYQQREKDLLAAQEWLNDAEMAQLAKEEIESAQLDLQQLHETLQTALLPRDPEDDRHAFLEIRAGTGGDESDLLRMYLRFAEHKKWHSEIMSESPSELGGYKEVVLLLEGERVYEQMKFESGGHRVQRVPTTETQGRIHTSACTVAVIPKADEMQTIELNPSDLRIDTFRASGAGGQHINKTDSAIRVTHLPTGLVAECQDDRSQHRNKAKALAVLAARLNEKERSERAAIEAATRKNLIGSGNRNDRIRTYNFAQGRLTDHRINLTLYKLQSILDGDLTEILASLQAARAAQQLALLEEGQSG
jgi:peptide chain release factor 1